MGIYLRRAGETNCALSEKEEVMARLETCESERGDEGEPELSAKKYGRNTMKEVRTC